MKGFLVGLLSVCVLVIALLGGGYLWNAWQSNMTNLRLLKGQSVIKTSDCSHISLVGMAAGQRGDRFAQRQALVQALDCSLAYLPLVQAVLPEDQELARLATQHYPASSQAWFWLGKASDTADPFEARQAYLRTVALAPYNAAAWCYLGLNYERNSEYEMAGEAYVKCCLNGDPGTGCCNAAGRVMEKLGDLQQAIKYYRLSHEEAALNRADELERQGKP